MIATHKDYLRLKKNKALKILDSKNNDIFNIEQLGANSYDLRLDSKLTFYKINHEQPWLDLKEEPIVKTIEIPDNGFILDANSFCLASTIEKTWATSDWIPMVEGRSTIGRAGLQIHQTAGVGDANFKGHWTLELKNSLPIKIYKGMRICQLILFQAASVDVENTYDLLSGNYNKQENYPKPYKHGNI